MAEAPSSTGLWLGFVLAGVVYAVLALLTTRRSTQSACSSDRSGGPPDDCQVMPPTQIGRVLAFA